MDINGKSVDQLLALAKISETAERYSDMCRFMKSAVESIAASGGGSGDEGTLSVEQRNLLSVAYKNVVGAKRASWRTLNAESDDDQTIAEYKRLIENELEGICQEVLDLLKGQLIPLVQGQRTEEEVFYNKMCGDYYRYLSEFKGDDATNVQNAEKMYSDAMAAAEGLVETHPTRLGLALNFSVCYYEILKQPEKACALAKKAFDAAIQKLDSLDDASYKDSTLIMQLLRDNLTLWTSEAEDQNVEDTED